MTTVNLPRPEHPDPQRFRDTWMNLNGPWDFAIDFGRSGLEAGWLAQPSWPGQQKINVPFCPESSLSGIEHKDFMPAVWYRRTFQVPAGWESRRIRLHFGAVDFDCRVWVNGNLVGRHIGGYTPFWFDITAALEPGHNEVVVYAADDVRTGRQPAGKQSGEYASYGCMYTRVTGIWQTVWLEAVGQTFVQELQIVASDDLSQVSVLAEISGSLEGCSVHVEAFLDGKSAGAWQGPAGSLTAAQIHLSRVERWDIGKGTLYDLALQIRDAQGAVIDRLASYFGLRKVELRDKKVYINDRPVFLRTVLDQGFWPDGIYTAPSDAELKADVERSMACGFNGARLHQKVFEARTLYWADKMGYLVTGEMGDWGMDFNEPVSHDAFVADWAASVRRDRNRPSLILWTPFNETHGRRYHTWDKDRHDGLLRMVYDLTKQLDPTRPVIDASGYIHVITDVYDIHNYEQDPVKFAPLFEALKTSEPQKVFRNFPKEDIPYDGKMPYFVSEYGGIWWNPAEAANTKAWGYGQRPATLEEFLRRFDALNKALLDNSGICGFCYTQLTDVEQEVNGLYTYDRKPKFDLAVIKKSVAASAAMEKE
jgi:beta-galactosidase/beta-glucuronidase